MKKSVVIALLISAFSLLTASGCVFAIGNREPARPHPTLGQQLIDLQKARASGAITEAEYQTQRAKFVQNP